MEITREMMKEEAVKRMKKLRIVGNAISEFKSDDIVNVSRGGFLYWLDDGYKKLVSDFEKEYGGVVYHCIESHTEIGKLLSVLYVSCHPEEWPSDMEDLKDGYLFVYVFNLDCDYFSEFGCIGVAGRYGGLVRTE